MARASLTRHQSEWQLDRIGAMARGAGIDPDSDELAGLHIAYKPPGINLADPGWAAELAREAADIDAALVAVDVLRAAARMRNENAADEFGALRDNLRPLTDAGRVVALAHHFGKLTELAKERSPGERMSGSGAMYGAMDLGVFITGSEHGARVLRLEFDGRDAAMPAPAGVRLQGAGSGDNGSLLYTDAAHFVSQHAPDPAELKAPATEIAAWVRAQGGHATPAEIREHFEIAEGTLRGRRADLAKLGIAYTGSGRDSRYSDIGDTADPATRNPAALRGDAVRGQKPPEQAELTPQPADPATEATGVRNGSTKPKLPPRRPRTPYGSCTRTAGCDTAPSRRRTRGRPERGRAPCRHRPRCTRGHPMTVTADALVPPTSETPETPRSRRERQPAHTRVTACAFDVDRRSGSA